VLGSVYVAIHTVLAPVSGAIQQRNLRIEPPNEDLLAGHALFRDDFQKRHGVAIISLEHLAHDGKEIPHPLWFSTSQWPQQRGPLGSGRRRSATQIINIAGRDERTLR